MSQSKEYNSKMDVKVNNVVVVENLNSATRERDLYDVFDRYGAIELIKLDRSESRAFIKYKDHRDAKDAARDEDGRRIDGSRVVTTLRRLSFGRPVLGLPPPTQGADV